MTGKTDYNLQKNQEIAKLAVTKSVILAGKLQFGAIWKILITTIFNRFSIQAS